jgi:hypothetical protein
MSDIDHISDLKDIEQKAYNAGSKIRTIIKNPIYDVRVSSFYFVAQAVRWFKVYLIIKDECLDDPHWYNDIYLSKFGQQRPEIGQIVFGIVNDHKVLVDESNQVMIVAYSQVLFSIIESKFRLFLTTVYPNALKKRRKSDRFHDVYECLLEETGKTQYEHLIWFFSLIRNTIHNNGKYTSQRIPCVCTKYKENIFKFEHDKMVIYHGGAFTLLLKQITPDVIDMMEDIVLNTEKIRETPSIPEPATQRQFLSI